MSWGDRAAEQHEKDQPSQYDADTLAYLEAAGISGALLNRVRNLVKRAAEQPSEIAVPKTCSFCGASGATIGIGDDGRCINVYKCQERRDMNKAFEQGRAEGRRVADRPSEIVVALRDTASDLELAGVIDQDRIAMAFRKLADKLEDRS